MIRIVIANSKGGCGKSTLSSALADVLPNAQLVDLDHQGLLTQASEITGRHIPVPLEKVNAKYLIYDTPPYLSEELPNVLKTADIILVPTRIGDYDLLALRGTIDRVRSLKKTDCTFLVFNAVPSIKSKGFLISKGYFLSNYKDIKKAKQN